MNSIFHLMAIIILSKHNNLFGQIKVINLGRYYPLIYVLDKINSLLRKLHNLFFLWLFSIN